MKNYKASRQAILSWHLHCKKAAELLHVPSLQQRCRNPLFITSCVFLLPCYQTEKLDISIYSLKDLC
jgi:hypothetical protein